MSSLNLWSSEDYLHHACSKDDIGTPKPVDHQALVKAVVQEDLSSSDVVSSLPPATMAELKQAALSFARGKHGSYEAFLAANPGFLQKFLLSMVKEPVPSSTAPLQVHVSWIGPERLSYKAPPLADVVDVVSTEPKPWKPEPDSSASRLQADIKKLSE